TLRDVVVTTVDGKPLKVFAPAQLAALLEVKTGDVFTYDKLRKSVKAVQDAYGRMGYMVSDEVMRTHNPPTPSVYVSTPEPLRVPDTNQVDLLLEVDEGRPYTVGQLL